MTIQSEYPGLKAEIKALKTIHLALLTGQVLFTIVSVFLVVTDAMEENLVDINGVLQVIVPLFTISGFIFSVFMFRNRLNTAKAETGLSEKLAEYRSALIIRYALLESPSLFAIVAYLLTSHFFYLGIAIMIMLYFLTIIPSTSRIADDLELNSEERSRLSGRD